MNRTIRPDAPDALPAKTSRRALLTSGALSLAWLLTRRGLTLGAQEAAEKTRGMRVTEIEVHEITVPYEDWIAYELNHFYGPTRRKVYVVHTNNGLIGLG